MIDFRLLKQQNASNSGHTRGCQCWPRLLDAPRPLYPPLLAWKWLYLRQGSPPSQPSQATSRSTSEGSSPLFCRIAITRDMRLEWWSNTVCSVELLPFEYHLFLYCVSSRFVLLFWLFLVVFCFFKFIFTHIVYEKRKWLNSFFL